MKKKAERRDFSLEIPSVRHAAEQTAADPCKPDRPLDILRLVSELPAHYRQVILLYHMEEKSYEEVAAMLDLPLGTVKTYLHRARQQLAEALAALNIRAMEENGA